MRTYPGINRRHRRATTALVHELQRGNFDYSYSAKASFYLHESICRCLRTADPLKRLPALNAFLYAQSESNRSNLPPTTRH